MVILVQYWSPLVVPIGCRVFQGDGHSVIVAIYSGGNNGRNIEADDTSLEEARHHWGGLWRYTLSEGWLGRYFWDIGTIREAPEKSWYTRFYWRQLATSCTHWHSMWAYGCWYYPDWLSDSQQEYLNISIANICRNSKCCQSIYC